MPLQGVAKYASDLFQMEETFDSFRFDLKSLLKCLSLSTKLDSSGRGLSS